MPNPNETGSKGKQPEAKKKLTGAALRNHILGRKPREEGTISYEGRSYSGHELGRDSIKKDGETIIIHTASFSSYDEQKEEQEPEPDFESSAYRDVSTSPLCNYKPPVTEYRESIQLYPISKPPSDFPNHRTYYAFKRQEQKRGYEEAEAEATEERVIIEVNRSTRRKTKQ